MAIYYEDYNEDYNDTTDYKLVVVFLRGLMF